MNLQFARAAVLSAVAAWPAAGLADNSVLAQGIGVCIPAEPDAPPANNPTLGLCPPGHLPSYAPNPSPPPARPLAPPGIDDRAVDTVSAAEPARSLGIDRDPGFTVAETPK